MPAPAAEVAQVVHPPRRHPHPLANGDRSVPPPSIIWRSARRSDRPKPPRPNQLRCARTDARNESGAPGAAPARGRVGRRRDPAGRGEFLDLRAGPDGTTDERRGRACRSARGDLAPDQRGNGQCMAEPVRRADVDDRGHMPSARARRGGRPEFVFPGGSVRPSDSIPPAGRSIGNRGRLIPAMPPYDRLPARTAVQNTFSSGTCSV